MESKVVKYKIGTHDKRFRIATVIGGHESINSTL